MHKRVGFKPGEIPKGAKPFKKGQSGNPSGRPANPFPALIRRATKDGELIVNTALNLLKRGRSEKTRAWACEFLRDTGWHRPVQGVRGMDDDGNSIPLTIEYVSAGAKAAARTAGRKD
jgi:hypothetical protein